MKIAVELFWFVLNYIGKLFGRVQPKEVNKILLKFFENGFFQFIYTFCHKVSGENTNLNAFRLIWSFSRCKMDEMGEIVFFCNFEVMQHIFGCDLSPET